MIDIHAGCDPPARLPVESAAAGRHWRTGAAEEGLPDPVITAARRRAGVIPNYAITPGPHNKEKSIIRREKISQADSCLHAE